MSTYCLQQVWVPTKICSDIDVAIQKIIWKGSGNHGIHLVNWDVVAQSRRFGGLGLRKARDHNIALLGIFFFGNNQGGTKTMGVFDQREV